MVVIQALEVQLGGAVLGDVPVLVRQKVFVCSRSSPRSHKSLGRSVDFPLLCVSCDGSVISGCYDLVPIDGDDLIR